MNIKEEAQFPKWLISTQDHQTFKTKNYLISGIQVKNLHPKINSAPNSKKNNFYEST